MGKGQEIMIPCPRCGKRICDCKGMPEGDFEIELECPGKCGFVNLSVDYLKKVLTNTHKKH